MRSRASSLTVFATIVLVVLLPLRMLVHQRMRTSSRTRVVIFTAVAASMHTEKQRPRIGEVWASAALTVPLPHHGNRFLVFVAKKGGRTP